MPLHLFHHLSHKAELTNIDRIINVAAVLYPLMGVPQALHIYATHNASDVSLISWLSFSFFSGVFLVYGLAHRLRPVIIAQSLWLVVNLSVAIGVMLYG
ncbi:MAG TPA: hypothetical protein VLF67_04940 [Candidatus Saccharimonas sp.]|nr:hypothetical protein [Candidatus Saccharimonas sp.]